MIPRTSLMAAALALAASVLVPASAQVLEEVPFVTTPDNVTLEMLRIAGVGKDDHVIDLGSGDGRIVILAAKRFGASGLGVEIVPDLVEKSRDNARRAKVADQTDFRVQDIFDTDLRPATVITMYLLPDMNLKLRPALLDLKPGTRIVSHDWDMGDWRPDQTVVLDVPEKKLGREKKSRVHLWVVPARVEGTWCGTGAARGASLRLEQNFQHFRGTLAQAGGKQSLAGRIKGTVLHASHGGAPGFALKDGQMRMTDAASSLAGAAFNRAPANGCATAQSGS